MNEEDIDFLENVEAFWTAWKEFKRLEFCGMEYKRQAACEAVDEAYSEVQMSIDSRGDLSESLIDDFNKRFDENGINFFDWWAVFLPEKP